MTGERASKQPAENPLPSQAVASLKLKLIKLRYRLTVADEHEIFNDDSSEFTPKGVCHGV
jgi:hypothetical protein